jgi:hypothetical protein
MESNWQNFLKNQGEWRGSFTQISAAGELGDSIQSILNLDVSADQASVVFRLRRFASGKYDDPPSQDYSQTYETLGRQACFFDTGAFSKGSLQLAPYSEFGAEYGFIDQDRRSRFVQLFNGQGEPSSFTLIREFRAGSDAQERPPLTVDQLIGTWQGQAETVFADWQPPQKIATQLEIRRVGDDQIQQQLSFANVQLSSTAKLIDNRLLFPADESGISREILLLPDGISSNIPSQLKLRQPFFVEAGWLLAPHRRQRLIRNYDATGAWLSATLVTEEKATEENVG